eukprot:CAMPEP_0185041750 /NCGR_PEP_ID=MMETSP1103-20130426/41437_1 /TAXON_ID=36769 /ORGANISM="Paraphysomonas bandaiensis, Strain Caron Lab Isolate" /LENGTH=42 /DNA_ID= /DNA_START= /DNA_END= /DNA_ORIENTATION=
MADSSGNNGMEESARAAQDENVSSSTSGKFMRFEKWLLENGA